MHIPFPWDIEIHSFLGVVFHSAGKFGKNRLLFFQDSAEHTIFLKIRQVQNCKAENHTVTYHDCSLVEDCTELNGEISQKLIV